MLINNTKTKRKKQHKIWGNLIHFAQLHFKFLRNNFRLMNNLSDFVIARFRVTFNLKRPELDMLNIW